MVFVVDVVVVFAVVLNACVCGVCVVCGDDNGSDRRCVEHPFFMMGQGSRLIVAPAAGRQLMSYVFFVVVIVVVVFLLLLFSLLLCEMAMIMGSDRQNAEHLFFMMGQGSR